MPASSKAVATRHVLQQGAVIAALGRTAWLAMQQGRKKGAAPVAPATPGPLIEITRPPLPRERKTAPKR